MWAERRLLFSFFNQQIISRIAPFLIEGERDVDYMGFYDKRSSNCLLYIDLFKAEKLLIVEVVTVISALQRLFSYRPEYCSVPSEFFSFLSKGCVNT